MEHMVQGRHASFAMVLGLLAVVAGVAAAASSSQTADAQAGLAHRVVLSNIVRDGTNPVAQRSFTVEAMAFKSGGLVEISLGVRSDAATSAVVDIEIYDSVGRRVDQQWFDNVAFNPGQNKSFTVKWAPPPGASGDYIVSVGLFEPGRFWGLLLHWTHRATSFSLP